MLFLNVLWNVVVPVFIVAALGVVLQRRLGVEPRTLSRVVFYVFSPCLVFSGLYRMPLDGDGVHYLVIFAGLMTLFMGGLGVVMSVLRRSGRSHASAVVLALLANNNGNYGLPLNQFAFGTPGLQLALLYFVFNATVTNSLGVYVASAGQAPPLRALRNVARAPLVYATFLALLWNKTQWPLPKPLLDAITLAGQAAVPVMLVILGIHLGRLGHNIRWNDAFGVTLAKLVVAPGIAWVISGLLGMSGLPRAVAIVQASMPTAVMATVLATEFDCEPEYVAELVFTTTLASMLTLTAVVTLVKAWVLY